jgi:hypothetical protein
LRHLTKFKSEVEDDMKIQNRIRIPMLVGLGAALLMAGSVRAQQDMDPTYFDVKPGAPAISKVVVRTAQSMPARVENARLQDSAAVVRGDSTLESSMTRIAIVDVGVVLVLFGGVALIGFYAMAATRRERSFQEQRGNARYRPVSAATAQ